MSSSYFQNDTKYWVYNDDPELPTIIMIHGLRGTHHGLELIAKDLLQYRIIVPDLPGFGQSKPMTGKSSIDNYVIWLCDFLKGLKLSETPILLGHSFGSIITSYYAEKYPSTISQMILVNPIGAIAKNGSKIFSTRLSMFYYWLGRVLPKSVGTKFLSAKPIVLLMSTVLAKTKNKKLRKFIHNQHLTHFSTFANRRVVNEAFQESITKSVREVAPKITNPTLLIAGDRDDITPLKKQQELVKLFPDAKLKVIKNVGHLTHYETPDQVADLITDFLRY